MKAKALLLAVACGLSASAALAQWQWIDEVGRRTFSDRPPPGNIPEKNILQRPAGSAAPRASDLPRAQVKEEGAQSPEAEAAQPTTPTPEQLQQQAQQQQAEAEEATLRRAEEARQAAQRQDNCRRAQASLRTLQSNVALAQINERGEQEVMSSTQRQQDIRRAQEIIARDCGPATTAP